MHLVRRTVVWSVVCLSMLLTSSLVAPVRAADPFRVMLPFIKIPGTPLQSTPKVPLATLYVDQKASPSPNCGTSDAPCPTISAGVAKAQPGMTISVAGGVYRESVDITVSGTLDQPITLLAAPGVTVASPSDKVRTTINVKASYWIIKGFEIAPIGLDSPAVEFNTGAFSNTLANNYIHGGQNNGVVLDTGSGNTQILTNTIADFRHPGNIDAHGIDIRDSDGNIIRGNHIYNNSGDGVQVFTLDTPARSKNGESADNTQILGNFIYQNDENAVDVKSSKGTVIRGNQMWGYKPALDPNGGDYRSDGMAIEVHYWARDVVVASNVITGSTWGIEVSRGEKGGVRFDNPPTNVTIHNNYIANMTMPQPPYPAGFDVNNKGNGAGIVIRESDGVKVLNNTVVSTAGYCMAITWPDTGTIPSNLQVLNNSFSDCNGGNLVLRSNETLSQFQFDYNHYGSSIGGRLFFSSKEYTLIAWQAAKGLDLHSLTTVGSGLIATILQPESALIDRGTDVGLPFCGRAPDIGAFEASCAP